jgi:octaprenyl-diphosphate synthase
LELIHMATLVHDDVIDESSSRRGRPTAAFEFGNTASVLSGDVLLAKAMRILAEDGDLAIIRCVSQGVVEMAEGEVRELAARGDFDLSESEHLDILQMKTASFIQTACEVGALAAGAPEATRKTLARYGRSMGMAFQIADDLLDYQGDPHRTGKPSAVDFREGCATLPLIFLRETLTSSERSAAAGWFGNGAMDENVERIRSWMAARGAFERTGAAAKAYVEEALSALRDLPETADKTLLSAVAEYVVGRSS